MGSPSGSSGTATEPNRAAVAAADAGTRAVAAVAERDTLEASVSASLTEALGSDAPALARTGRAVHEEQVLTLGGLLTDLTHPAPEGP
ncbi:MAG: hypothetical protein ACRDYX_16970 [Egibacteraceae bacterium]